MEIQGFDVLAHLQQENSFHQLNNTQLQHSYLHLEDDEAFSKEQR